MNWSSLLSTFGLIFIAELGDKTQLAVVTQTCKFRSPWAVFAGGSLALTAVTAVGDSRSAENVDLDVVNFVVAADEVFGSAVEVDRAVDSAEFDTVNE